MLNPTYKHLEEPVKLAGLSYWQWVQLMALIGLAYAISKLLPLPGQWGLSIAITVCGMPAIAAIVAMEVDFDVVGYLRAAIKWLRVRTRHEAGADRDAPSPGYRLRVSVSTLPDRHHGSNRSRLR